MHNVFKNDKDKISGNAMEDWDVLLRIVGAHIYVDMGSPILT